MIRINQLCRFHFFTKCRVAAFQTCASSGTFAYNKTQQNSKTLVRHYGSNFPSDYGKYAEPNTVEHFYYWLVDTSWIKSVESYLMTVHDVTGSPWWLSIFLSTLMIRSFIMTPLMIVQMQGMAKYRQVMPLLKKIDGELQKEVKVATEKFKWTKKMAYMQYQSNLLRHQKTVFKKYKVPGIFRRYFLPWVQIPLWMSLSVSMRDLTMSLPITLQPSVEQMTAATQLSQEGCLWFQNLCVADPYFILPVVFCVANLSVIEIYRGDGKTPLTGFSKFLVYTVRGLSVIMLPIACQMPAGVVLYWTYSSFYGVLQALLLRSRKVRTFFKIPIPKHESQTPYRDILGRFRILKK